MDSFLKQLAEGLPLIHRVDSQQAGQRLPRYERYFDDDELGLPPTWARNRELWNRARAIAGSDPPPGRDCLIHRDYHPGNTLWLDSRLTGIVDWTQGSWGRAAVDTAHMRWNLAVDYGVDTAETFLEYYRLVASNSEEDQGYWDVVTLLDLIPDIKPGSVPGNWDLYRLEQYLDLVISRLS
jgi:aminoglycoside phosphotransferase (APT) family kinase protein